MMLYKNVIISLVTLALFSSSSTVIYLIKRCSQFRDDVTFPLLISVFSAGLTQGLFGILAMIISWFELQNVQFLLRCSFWIMLVSVYADYFSLAGLSCIKLIAVVKPFVFQRTVTSCKMTITTICIWITSSCALSPVLFYPDLVTFRPASQTPVFDFKQEKVFHLVWRTIPPMLYIPNILLLLSNAGLFIITIKHAIRIQLMKRRQVNVSSQEESESPLTRAIMAALWSAKGVMVLSLVRLTIHLPFFLMESRQRDVSDLVFYFQWGIISGPIFNAVCFIGCSKTLRQLIMVKCKCINKIQPLTEQRKAKGNLGSNGKTQGPNQGNQGPNQGNQEPYHENEENQEDKQIILRNSQGDIRPNKGIQGPNQGNQGPNNRNQGPNQRIQWPEQGFPGTRLHNLGPNKEQEQMAQPDVTQKQRNKESDMNEREQGHMLNEVNSGPYLNQPEG